MSKIDKVLFDIGGVLVPDAMQTVLFTPINGLVDRLGLDWERAYVAMTPAYRQFNHEPMSKEEDFWKAFGKEYGTDVSYDLVEEIDRELVIIDPQVSSVMSYLKDGGYSIGVISNNTDFWYSKHAKDMEFDQFVDPNLVFLSHTHGASKPVGLFKHVLEVVDPEECLFIDDRSDNIYIANYLGFATMHYSLQDTAIDLMTAVEAGLNNKLKTK